MLAFKVRTLEKFVTLSTNSGNQRQVRYLLVRAFVSSIVLGWHGWQARFMQAGSFCSGVTLSSCFSGTRCGCLVPVTSERSGSSSLLRAGAFFFRGVSFLTLFAGLGRLFEVRRNVTWSHTSSCSLSQYDSPSGVYVSGMGMVGKVDTEFSPLSFVSALVK